MWQLGAMVAWTHVVKCTWLLEVKLSVKFFQKVSIIFDLMVYSERVMSMAGREIQSLTRRPK